MELPKVSLQGRYLRTQYLGFIEGVAQGKHTASIVEGTPEFIIILEKIPQEPDWKGSLWW
jgi:hypothetical protein